MQRIFVSSGDLQTREREHARNPCLARLRPIASIPKGLDCILLPLAVDAGWVNSLQGFVDIAARLGSSFRTPQSVHPQFMLKYVDLTVLSATFARSITLYASEKAVSLNWYLVGSYVSKR